MITRVAKQPLTLAQNLVRFVNKRTRRRAQQLKKPKRTVEDFQVMRQDFNATKSLNPKDAEATKENV